VISSDGSTAAGHSFLCLVQPKVLLKLLASMLGRNSSTGSMLVAACQGNSNGTDACLLLPCCRSSVVFGVRRL
jgi:hypothetical protein